MKSIELDSGGTVSYTLLSDLFVDRYMPRANGEYVKIYIYLLRAMQKKASALSIASVADVFACTEADVVRALTFWEKEGLLLLTRKDGEIVSVRLPEEDGIRAKETAEEKSAAENGAGDVPVPDGTVTNDRRRVLKENDGENVELLITIAERYIGKTLGSTDLNRLLYLYDSLGFSVDLIDYLIEYCVSIGKRSMRYIESVGLRWYNDGIKTVPEAKRQTTLRNPQHYKIMRYLGISNRDPLPSEAEFMTRWTNIWGFSPELIREACTRALQQTTRQTPANLFKYADKILKSWNDDHITTLAQVAEKDRAYEKSRDAKRADDKNASGGTRKNEKANAFNNFQQRKYDYDDLERKLRAKNRKTESP